MIKNIEAITDFLIDESISNIRIVGKDQYSDLNLEYPECYAMFIISLNYKYRITNNVWYRDQAEKYIGFLLELANKTDEEIWWGLPFDWGDTKTSDGFLITTAFCLKALYVWYEDGVFTDNDTIKKVLRYCFSLYCENGEDGFCYSRKLNKNIYNATSIAVGVMAQAKEFLSSKQIVKLNKSVDTLIASQKHGYWNYSNEKVDVDLLHQCYTCEGIFEYANRFDSHEALKAALTGVDFIVDNMNVEKMERYLFKLSDPEKKTTKLKYLLLRAYSILNTEDIRFSKPRAWSFGAYIRVLIYSYSFSKEKKYLKVLNDLISYFNSNLILDKSILFSVNSKDSYVRNTFHILHSLCQYEFFISNGEDYD